MIKIRNEAKMSIEYFERIEEIITNTIDRSKELNLDEVKEIDVVDNIPNIDSDGRYENDRILLFKDKMEEYLKNGDVDTIKSIIYHELCHAEAKKRLPQLHALHEKYMEEENYIKGFTIMVYIEYVTHKKSIEYEEKENIKRFLESINNIEWNFENYELKIKFVKYVPYVLVRVFNNPEYINIIKDREFTDRIIQVKEIIERINNGELTDDYSSLHELEMFVSKYISND